MDILTVDKLVRSIIVTYRLSYLLTFRPRVRRPGLSSIGYEVRVMTSRTNTRDTCLW